MEQVYKNPLEQANALVNQTNPKPKRKTNDTFSFNGKRAWSGSVSALDGVIEEVHPFKTAENSDFHHSFYFSQPTLEKMDNGESLFFFVDENGKVNIDPIGRTPESYDEKAIIDKILQQIKI